MTRYTIARFSAIVAAACVFVAAAGALEAPSAAPELASRSALLLDATSGETLYEKDADLEIPPASLTKLMTMHVTLEAVEAGRVSLDDAVALPRQTWAINQPWGSSLMFLAPGQTVTLRELLLGLAVASGNDAAVAVAIHVGGTVAAFVESMNAAARELGMERTKFVDPSGYSELNMTTAREYARFCAVYVARHPRALVDFHAVKEFSYPKPENLPEAFRDRPRTIAQTNRNLLLGEIDGVDGLKTGYIIESGYNIAITGERSGSRFIAVLLGGPGSSSSQGGRIRAEDAGKLISWAFDSFRTIRPEIERLEPARIYKGAAKTVALESAGPLAFAAPSDRAKTVAYDVVRKPAVIAPVAKGNVLGEIVFSDEKGELKRVPLVAAADVERGNFFRRAADAVALFFLKLFGKIS